MRRLLLAAVIGALASAEARAEGWPPHMPRPVADNHGWGPHTTSVTWPSLVPPGWYSATYNYRWYYPWYAYYNFSNGPYANWPATGGYAGYAYHGRAGLQYSYAQPAEPYIGQWYTGNDPAGVLMAREAAGAAGSYNALQGMTASPKKDDKKGEKKDDKGNKVDEKTGDAPNK